MLGGTSEAAAFAEALGSRGDADVTTSLAGRTRRPRALPGTVRIGGFGGVDGLAAYLRDEHVSALIDATHPFAAEISAHAVVAAERAGIPRLVLSRPEWTLTAGDRWTEVGNLSAAADVLRTEFADCRVFLALGSGGLAPFVDIAERCVVRLAEPPAGNPLPGSVVIVDRGPFREGDDAALLMEHRIGVVVSKNAGGAAAYAKIAAARSLALPVVMVARPPAPPGPTVTSVDDAVRWLDGVLAGASASAR
ncbi:MAG: cobalt-precorrin-6A reductase [Gemmatimonas sp.]